LTARRTLTAKNSNTAKIHETKMFLYEIFPGSLHFCSLAPDCPDFHEWLRREQSTASGWLADSAPNGPSELLRGPARRFSINKFTLERHHRSV
jgi:hypothetical protein